MHPARGYGGGGATTKVYDDSLESGGNHHHHGHLKFSGVTVALKVTLLLAVLGVTCLVLNQSTYSVDFFRKSNSFSNMNSYSFHLYTSQTPGKRENRELEKTLRKAAMKNRTVIITTLNAAWTEPNSIFDLFLESFRIGNGTAELLKHVVVGAFDQTAYNRCVAEGLHCYAVTTEGVDFSGEATFMSEDYLKMMWRRIDLLRTVLELGYDFVFTDADVMWLRNPFERFYQDGDFQIACDHYWAGYTDTANSPNGGFNYVRANNRTIQFYKFWHTGQFYFPGKHDQDVLNLIKDNPFIQRVGLQIRFLDTAYYGGFWEPSKDLDLVITMHANCCIGLNNKLHDIKMMMDDWKRYTSLPAHQRNSTVKSGLFQEFVDSLHYQVMQIETCIFKNI